MDEFTLKGKRVVGIFKIAFGGGLFITIALFLPHLIEDLGNYPKMEACFIFSMFTIPTIVITYMSIKDGISTLYNHIDVKGDEMTIYMLTHKPVVKKCYEIKKIVVTYSPQIGGKKIHIDLSDVEDKFKAYFLESETINFNKLMLYLKRKNVIY